MPAARPLPRAPHQLFDPEDRPPAPPGRQEPSRTSFITFKGQAPGELTHLIQDLVLDKAFGAGTSASFRRLLGQAEGEVTVWTQAAKNNTVKLSEFGAHSRSGANTTFLEGETRMRTGDYVWRWTYDLLYEKEALRRLPQPEAVGPQLDALLDVP